MLIDAGLLADLTGQAFVQNYDPAATQDACSYNGKAYCVNLGRVSYSGIYYNKDLFDAAKLPYPPHQFGEPYTDGDPWTIAKMEAIALQLTLDASGKNATDA